AESLRNWLAYALNGEKFSTPKCEVSFRRSTAVDIEDEDKFLEWCQKNQRDDLLTFKEPTISKRAIMDALKMGWEIPYCRLEERKNVGVK
ncbi:MAG: siphovirus Gp157 family protein, partial [Bacteroidales bacterium]|nr:siphovirus Gp157 family protein [Bacteroidales bacterium]